MVACCYNLIFAYDQIYHCIEVTFSNLNASNNLYRNFSDGILLISKFESMLADPVPFDKIKENVKAKVNEVINSILKDKKYDAKEAPNWAHAVSEGIMYVCVNMKE